MEPTAEKVILRNSVDDDLPFIFASWLRGLRHGNDWFGLIDSGAYFSAYHKVIEDIINDPFVKVKIACLASEPNTILAYSVSAGSKVHWVYCKNRWRGIGIAKSLLPSNIEVITHVTKHGRGWLKAHPGVVFNPFKLL